MVHTNWFVRIRVCVCIQMEWNILYIVELHCVCVRLYCSINMILLEQWQQHTERNKTEQTAIKSAYFMPICCCSDFCVYTHITRDYVLNTCHVSLKLQRRENIYRNWSSNFHPRLISTSVRCVFCLAFLFLLLLFVCCRCCCCFCCYISLLFIHLLFLPFSICACLCICGSVIVLRCMLLSLKYVPLRR